MKEKQSSIESATSGWPVIREVTKEFVKLITQHGIPRILIACGLVISIFFLVKIPSDDWRVNTVLLVSAMVLIIIGAIVRLYEMKNRLFSGRIFLLRCSNPKCRRIITEGFKLEGNPPASLKCNHCDAINIIQ